MYKRPNRKSVYKISLALILLLICSSFTFASTGDGTWDSAYTISQAIDNQDGTIKTIQGFVVGEPISTTNINTSGFVADYAIALSDSQFETNSSNMIYVQISKNNRNNFGLKSNPELIGQTVKVRGTLTRYFSNSGLKNISTIEKSSVSTDPITTDTSSYDDTYYKNAIGQTGDALKNTLHNIIDDHTELSYRNVWDALRNTDEDPNNSNNVIEIYTGKSISKNNNGGSVNDWNREHVWAKSHGNFGTRNGAGTDLHHIRPSDVSVNSNRSNLDFDEGGTYNLEATLCKYDHNSWEPRDEVKGDVARMIFYMAVRYEGDSNELDLELTDYVSNGNSPYHGKLSVLLKWHANDPVDDFERNRNDIIYSNYQFNRNPFIDHPEWVNEIW